MGKGRYQKIINFIQKEELFAGKIKNQYAEYGSIKKKRNLYDNVNWTEDQQKLFDEFWIKNYGKKIPNKWHKLYQNVNGTFCEKYFPEYLYSIYLEPLVNSKQYSYVFSDKNLLHSLFGDITGLRIPNSYLSVINGNIFYRNFPISINDATLIFKNLDTAVCKPSVDSGSGKGVKVLSKEEISKIEIEELMCEYDGNFVVQEKIKCCNELQLISPNAVSTFRVITFLTDKGIFTAPLALRLGTGFSKIDNIHAGGLVIAVEDNGKLYSKAYKLGYGDNNVAFTNHPDTNIGFENYCIPSVKKMIEIAKEAHKKIPQLGIISWDFTINSENEVVLIEANIKDQSVWFPQMVSGKPLFGDQTEYILNLIRNKS